MPFSTSIPTFFLLLVGLAVVVGPMRRVSAARRHHALRVLLVAGFAIPFLAPLFLFTPKVAVVTLPAHAVQAAPAWVPETVLPQDAWRVRGTALDETLPTRQSRMSAAALWTFVNLLVVGLISASTVRAGIRLRSIVATAVPDGEIDGVPVLRATDARLGVPVTFGRTILLPDSAEAWSPERRQAALLHEAAHVARCDWVWLIAARAGLTFFWFNPGFWLLAQALRATAEAAADDAVLARGVLPSDYARELLEVARSVGGFHGSAVAMVGRHGLKERVRAVLAPRRDRRRATVAFGVGAAGLVGGLAFGSGSLETRMPRLEMPEPAGTLATYSPYKVLPDGTVVELRAVQSFDFDRIDSWSPSGTAVEGMSIDHMVVLDRRNPHRLAFRFRVDPKGASDRGFTLSLPQPFEGEIVQYPDAKGQRKERFEFAAVAPFKGDALSTTVLLGVSDGPYASERHAVTPQVDPPGLYAAHREFVRFPMTHQKDEIRVQALTNDKRWIFSNGFASPNPSEMWADFLLRPKETIRELWVRHRPYRWVSFRNVALVPMPEARRLGGRPILKAVTLKETDGRPIETVFHVIGVAR